MVSITEVTDAASGAISEFQETGNKSAGTNDMKAPGSSSDVPNLKSKRTRARRPSIRKNSAQRQGRRLLRRYHEWKSAHLYLARYSIEKMLAFESYRRVASPMRVLFVVTLTPLPALIIVLLLAVIPIQSPQTHATTQVAFFVQSWLSFGVMTFGMLMYMRSALALPQNIYSHRQCALISLLTAGSYEILMFFVSMLWRFPIPLGGIAGLPVYAVLFVGFHILVFKKQLRYYQNRLRGYRVMYFVQLLTFFVYYGVSIIFKTASGWRKGFIAVAFAMLRPILKGTLRLIAASVEDMSTELTFCVVEVFAAYFQNVCLQSACLASYDSLLIAASSVQAGLEVLMFAKHEFVVDGHHATRTVFKIVESALFPGALVNGMNEKTDQNGLNSTISHRSISVPRSSSATATKSATFAKRSNTKTKKVACIDSLTAMSLDVTTIELGEIVHHDPELRSQSSCTATSSRRTFIDDMEFAHRHHAKLLSQTLELMNASEVLVSSHYFDISCSVIYGLYVFVVYHSPSAVYYLPFIGLTPEKIWRSALFHGIFAIVAGFIFFSIFMFIQAKFGFSIFYQLAFALEKYWMSVQGKLIATFALIFILDTVHQGMDFSLKFDWEQIMAGTTYTRRTVQVSDKSLTNHFAHNLTMVFDLLDPSSLLLPPPGKRHDKQLSQNPTARLQRICRSVADSTGTGFVYGTMFGSVLAVVEGMRASPKEQRLRGALHHAKVFVPETAGRIAMVTCLFRVAAFGIEEVRDKRDMWNTLLAAPVAGAMVKVRHGPRAALNNAFVFGSFAAVVVAFNLMETKVMHETSSPEEVLEEIAFAEEFE